MLDQIEGFLGDDHGIRIDEREFQTLVGELRSHTDHDAVLSLVQSFHDEPTRNPLNRLGIQAVRVAQQLRKPITVSTADNGLRLPATRFEDLWLSAVHMVRNAVDHGFESVDARLAADKDPTGTITLSTTMVGEDLVIACNDDGGGVDWQRVADKARARGLACSTHDELVDALFSDGLSTRDEVSDWSGRGVGLSAVKAAVTALGGSVRVASTPGVGTASRTKPSAATVATAATSTADPRTVTPATSPAASMRSGCLTVARAATLAASRSVSPPASTRAGACRRHRAWRALSDRARRHAAERVADAGWCRRRL
jgi:hypothetical protein